MIVQLPDRRLRVAFFGTPELARTIFQALLDANEDDVVLAVCQPDRPSGRGKKLTAPPVKTLAEERGIEVAQPAKMKDGTLAALLRARELDLAIVAAFGRILPEEVLAAIPNGYWNVHASLLPRHRGASPIQHAILLGDEESGISLMQITPGLDEGPVMLTRATPIAPGETATTLAERLARIGAELTLEGIRRAKKEGLDAIAQDATRATYAPLIDKEHGVLDVTQPAIALERRVRAFDPWPGTTIQVGKETLRALEARAVPAPGTQRPPGTVLAADKSLIVQTGDGALEILRIQPPGKNPMRAADYLRGAGKHLRAKALEH